MKPTCVSPTIGLLLMALSLFSIGASAQSANDYRSASTGNWNSLSSWQRFNGTTWLTPTMTEGTPNNSDGAITIRNTHQITVTANVSADQLTIDAGGELEINSSRTLTISNGTGTDLIVNGELENRGTVVMTGTSTFNSGSEYIHNRNGGTIPSATWNTASTCRVNGITSTAPSGLNQAFGNLTWDCIGQSTGFLLNGVLTTINGDLTVGNTNTYGLFLATANNSTYTLTIAGDLIVNDNAWLSIAYGDNITATVNVSGDFIMSGASSSSTFFTFHDATGGSITLNKIILSVNGNFTQSGGLVDFASGDSNAPNFTELQLAGNFSMTGTGVIQTGSMDNSISNGLISFNKAGTQTFSVTTPGNLAFANFTINSGSTLQLLSDVVLSSSATPVWGGQFNVAGNGTLDLGTNRVVSSSGTTAGVNNAFYLNADAHIISMNAGGLEQNATTGSISTAIATRSYRSDADYEFKNTSTGVFATTPLANTARDIIINNMSGSVTLNQPMTITRSFTLTNGTLVTTATNLLTINDNATATGGNYSPARFVDGPVKKIGNDAFTFPVGKSGVYAPVGISSPALVTDAFQAEYVRGSGTGLGSVSAPGLVRVSNCEYWNLAPTAGSSSVNVTLSWSGGSNCNAAAYVNDLTSLVVAHFGTTWDAYGNDGGTTGTAAMGTVTWNNVSAFSPFTLGSTSALTNPLPVKFTAVKAYPVGSSNKIEWTNLTETDIDEYEIERSIDGITFVQVVSVSPRSNTSNKEQYVGIDNNTAAPVIWYRIKAKELNGSVTYSQIVRVSRSDNDANKLVLFPNPVTAKQITLQLYSVRSEDYSIRIFNNAGQQVLVTSWQHSGGSASKSVELPGLLPSGYYHLIVSGTQMNISAKFVVK